MFKKLKDKITEEVKISPHRFQQLTQSVSDKFQGTQLVPTEDNNMFSIGEDDLNSSSRSTDQGYSSVNLVSPSSDRSELNRTRRLSNSSISSDVSFLPRYEAPNMYHLQSDLDASASELEDNLSQASSQLGISKEQILTAYRKSQMRYHKYRGRYTDLARHYAELERENSKIQAVLVKTQDNAIRKVRELKEQCTLEQEAKAHLESALRNDLDEKQMTIDSLLTKIDLLKQENNENKFEELNRTLSSEIELLNNKIQEYKANSIVLQSQEVEYKIRISSLEKDIEKFSEREKENNIKLAENKMQIHQELLNKDAEIVQLKQEIENFRITGGTSTKAENLIIQNNKLIEKLENLTIKCNSFENERLKIEKYKMDIKDLEEKNELLSGKLTEALKLHEHFEQQITEIKDTTKKNILTMHDDISEKLRKLHNEKEVQLKEEFQCKIKEISANNQSVSELQLQLVELNDENKKLIKKLESTKEKLANKELKYKELEDNHLSLIEETHQLKILLENLKRHVSETANEDNKSYEEKIGRLQATIMTLQGDLENLQKYSEDKETCIVQLEKEFLNLQNANTELMGKFRLLEEKQENTEMEVIEDNLLEMKVQALEKEKHELEQSFEQERKLFNEILEEHKDLKMLEITVCELGDRNKKLEEKIIKLKGYLNDKERNIVEINKAKLELEQELTKMRELSRINEERDESVELDKSECGLLKMKLQQLEEENKNILTSIENERETLNQHLEKTHEEYVNHKEDILKENVSLAKENLQLKDINNELSHKVRIYEEGEQVVQMESSECNMLKLKLQELENEKKELLHSFEMEREMFNKISAEHKELKVNEERIKDLESSNVHLREKIFKLKEYLNNKEENIVKLQENNLHNEQEITKLKESLQIKQEQLDSLQMEQIEYGLMEIKLNALKEEKENLLKSFQYERETFETLSCKESSMEDDNTQLKQEINNLLEEKNNLEENLNVHKQYAVEYDEKYKKMIEAVKNEQIAKKEAIDKVKEMQQELEKDNLEISEIKKSLESVEKLYNKVKVKHSTGIEQLQECKKKINELNNENVRLEKELQKKQDEFQFKTKEMNIIEQQFSALADEKEVIVQNNRLLKQNIEKLQNECDNKLQELAAKAKELDQIKSQSENVQAECDNLNQEIAELKTRINQLITDNENINEQNKKLVAEVEEYKGKWEMFEQIERERNDLMINIQDLRKKLDEQNSTPNKDLQQIQREFLEIKEKCEKLHLENKNLNGEYSKLEEQCSNFSKIKKDLETQLEELEKHYNELLHEKQLLNDEIQELKISPIENKNKLQQTLVPNGQLHNNRSGNLENEIESLREKLTQYKSLDLTNKSSIDFYENELQKMKLKNEKLNRKLDETLVTLNHCTELGNSTEIEYLKNVLYNYMLGKESIVLARVIAAVCKFDPIQTENVLQKEQQKQTLLGQLGIL